MLKERVNFFVAGVQKAGTSALDFYLRKHPSIQMAKTKEVHHFDDETNVNWSDPAHDRLHAQYDWSVPDMVRGEATPIYTYWPPSLARLRAYNTAAKIIVGLRHPVFRAYSHWKMEWSRGAECHSFEVAVSDKPRNRVRTAPMGVHRVFSYIERGLYAPQIKRLLDLFPRQQVHFFRTDALWQHPAVILTSIERFLGLGRILGEKAASLYYVSVDASFLGELPQPSVVYHGRIFESDIRDTAELTGLDLSDWLEHSYCEQITAHGHLSNYGKCSGPKA